VGLALLVVLDTIAPAERVAFVLHDVFGVPFEDIARIVDRSPMATRQLASRGRRRVQGVQESSETDVARQRVLVDAFLAAARGGDFDALVAVLDPDVVLRSDRGAVAGASVLVRGAATVASRALTFARFAESAEHVLVNGAAGVLGRAAGGRLFSVMAFRFAGGRIVEIIGLADPVRLGQLHIE
jgi:RNA polymerase sigma-70 factor (ECF subfamily)